MESGMLRDTMKNKIYFDDKINFNKESTGELKAKIANQDNATFMRLKVAFRFVETSLIILHECYARGDNLNELKPLLNEILSVRQQQKMFGDLLPLKEQKRRVGWEEIRQDYMRNTFLKWLAFAYCLDMGEVYYKQVLDLIANQGQDALLDEIAVQLGDTERPISDKLLYKTRFNKLYKVIQAAPDKRPKLMMAYLDAWYKLEGSPENHLMDNNSYRGYWSWEAALVTKLYGIEDSLFIDHEYYPKDLVHWSEQ